MLAGVHCLSCAEHFRKQAFSLVCLFCGRADATDSHFLSPSASSVHGHAPSESKLCQEVLVGADSAQVIHLG